MAPNNDDFAIVIGIDTYSRLFRLRSAHGNAVEFAQWLQSPDGGGLPASNINLILGPERVTLTDARPVQHHIDAAFRALGVDVDLRIGRRLYFYFSGHGFGPDFDDVGMLLIDASESDLNSNIAFRRYRSFFHNHHLFDEVVFILDCCRDHVSPSANVIGGRPSFDRPRLPAAGDDEVEVEDFVVLGAAYGKKAYAPRSKNNGPRSGLLTTAVLEALSGKGKAWDPQGRVTSESLQSYIVDRVPQLVDELKADPRLKKQKPKTMRPDREIVLTTIPADRRTTTMVRIVAGPSRQGDLILKDGTLQEIDRRPCTSARAANPWECPLQGPGLFAVEHSESGEQIIVQLATSEAQAAQTITFP